MFKYVSSNVNSPSTPESLLLEDELLLEDDEELLLLLDEEELLLLDEEELLLLDDEEELVVTEELVLVSSIELSLSSSDVSLSTPLSKEDGKPPPKLQEVTAIDSKTKALNNNLFVFINNTSPHYFSMRDYKIKATFIMVAIIFVSLISGQQHQWKRC